MQNAQAAPVRRKQSQGLAKSVGGLCKELFGQLVTARFWKDLLVFTLKTAFRVAGEMAIVAGGHAMIEMGRKFGKGNGPELDAIKEKFGNGLQPAVPAPAPVAAAFSRSFNPSTSYPPPPPSGEAWPGLAQFR